MVFLLLFYPKHKKKLTRFLASFFIHKDVTSKLIAKCQEQLMAFEMNITCCWDVFRLCVRTFLAHDRDKGSILCRILVRQVDKELVNRITETASHAIG